MQIDRQMQIGLYLLLLVATFWLYIICFTSLINGFKIDFIYYLNYTISIKEVNGFKYNYGYQMRRLCTGCAQAMYRLCVKRTQYRLVYQVSQCPQLRANYVDCR